MGARSETTVNGAHQPVQRGSSRSGSSAQIAAREWKPPKDRGWVLRAGLAVFGLVGVVALAGVINFANDKPQTNEEVRAELQRAALNAGLSPSQAPCFVDAADARFDLTEDYDATQEDSRFIVRTLLECGGMDRVMAECMANDAADRMGENLLPEPEDRQFLLEASLRCRGASDEQTACVLKALLDRYPDAFEEEVLTADRQKYLNTQVVACA